MMGIKERAFGPLPSVTLEELVPPDHFYRHVEAALDLAFVRDVVREAYAGAGRPSIDPVVFFKLQLVMFFEDIRSERQLMRVVADRLSLRWYLGYDLAEPVPDHSSLTCIRDRYGLAIFSRRSSRSAKRQGWCGARNSMSTRRRWRPMPPSRRCTPGSPSRPTSRTSSPRRTALTRVVAGTERRTEQRRVATRRDGQSS